MAESFLGSFRLKILVIVKLVYPELPDVLLLSPGISTGLSRDESEMVFIMTRFASADAGVVAVDVVVVDWNLIRVPFSSGCGECSGLETTFISISKSCDDIFATFFSFALPCKCTGKKTFYTISQIVAQSPFWLSNLNFYFFVFLFLDQILIISKLNICCHYFSTISKITNVFLNEQFDEKMGFTMEIHLNTKNTSLLHTWLYPFIQNLLIFKFFTFVHKNPQKNVNVVHSLQ